MLSCDDVAVFWISWEDDRIAVGSGSVVGIYQLMVYQDPDGVYPVSGISLSAGAVDKAVYTFQETPGEWV